MPLLAAVSPPTVETSDEVMVASTRGLSRFRCNFDRKFRIQVTQRCSQLRTNTVKCFEKFQNHCYNFSPFPQKILISVGRNTTIGSKLTSCSLGWL